MFEKRFGYALAIETTMVMPAVVPPLMLAGISRMRDGTSNKACGDNSADGDGRDDQSVGAARGRGRNRASGDDRRRTQRQKNFSH